MPEGLLLAPGAGAGRDQSSLVAIEEALAPMPVRRMDFPYRLAGRRAPDRAPVLLAAMAGELAAFCHELGCAASDIVLGGRSMGGRTASMLAAEMAAESGADSGAESGADSVVEGTGPVAGLALISYPLHPPGKAEKLRTAHLPSLAVPVLFISGTRDPFGTPEEFDREIEVIPGPTTFHWIEGARHDLRGKDTVVAGWVAEWIAAL